MKFLTKKGTTSKTILVFIQDSSSTTGAGLTGLAWDTGSLSWYYYREEAGTGATQVTLATMTIGTWATGGFIELDATDMPGWYELGLPDAMLATGADFVGSQLKGATNMAQLNLEIQLTDMDLSDVVRGGMTALPAAAADAAGGLPISDLGGLDLDTQLAATNEITAARMGALTDWIDAGRLDLILDAILGDVTGIAGAAMRGTDSAALASEVTAARMSELDAGTGGKMANQVDLIKTEADKIALVDAGVGVAGSVIEEVENVLASVGALNDVSTADLDAALAAIHLDHLLAVDYDPAAKPGVATALLNELIESDAGISRYTANALEQAPSGGASAADIADAVWDEPVAGHVAAGSFGKTDADILADTNELQADDIPTLIADVPTVAEFNARTLVAASYFDPAADTVALVTTVTNQNTLADIADAVWDEARAGHVAGGSFGEGVIVETNSDKTGYAIAVGGIAATSFAAGAIDAAAISVDFTNEIWDKVCEDQASLTAQEILSILLSACAGVTAGSTFSTPNGVSTRITATLNASEERTAIALAPSAGA